MATNVERKKLARKNAITHLPSERSGRTLCGRAIFNLTRLTTSGVYNCLMCEKTNKKEKAK